MKSRRFLLFSAILAFILFGLSLRITREDHPAGLVVSVPDFSPIVSTLQTMQTGTLHLTTAQPGWKFVVDGPEKLHATSASDWFAVRQSATWANNNSTLADNLITSLKNSGLLKNSGTVQSTATVNGVLYKVKLQTGGCGANCTGVTAAAASGLSFTNRFKMWRASDNANVLELMFNDVTNPTSGILLTYNLGILSPTVSDNTNLIVESYISGASPSRHQTYSWGAQFWLSGSNAASSSDRGRVVLDEMTLGLKNGGTATGLCVRIAARTVSMTTGCGTGNHYYALAYGQKTTSNFETTAQSGVALGSLATGGTVCGANILGIGIFNGGGFIQDGLNASTVPTGYPDPSAGAGGYPGVQTVFGKINTAPNGAGTYDDLTLATINGLNTTVTFHPTSDPPGF